jgi:GT2 family glycosyltransferase
MDLSIVYVNFNDGRNLEASLASLEANPPDFEHEVLVVDNASTDGSRDLIIRKFPSVRWMANAENEGFAKANNKGARESRGAYLLFLNTDTIVPAGALDRLLGRMKAETRAGAAGPALVRDKGCQVSFGNRVSFVAQFFQKAFLNPYYKATLRRRRTTRNVGWLSAACLLCRRPAFEAAGGFDERFFIYFEDIDLCYRLRKAGRTLLFIPEIEVRHEGGSTTAPRRAESRFEYRRSQLYFYAKHNSRTSDRLLRFYLRLNVLALRIRGAFRGDEGAKLREAYRRLLAKAGGR